MGTGRQRLISSRDMTQNVKDRLPEKERKGERGEKRKEKERKERWEERKRGREEERKRGREEERLG
jgi:hypothetical protein